MIKKNQTVIKERGQVGIGTLIVFIALVLVAAIAAGVLINTAGFLQTQAEETGEDSTSQVADNINVIGEVGQVTDLDDSEDLTNIDDERFDEDDQAIYEASLTVQRSPGSGSVDLTGLSIQWVGDNGFAQLIHVSEFDEDETPRNIYFIQEVTSDGSDDAVLTDDGDRYDIVIPLGLSIDFNSNGGDAFDVFALEEGGPEEQELFSGSEAAEVYGDDVGTDVVVSFDDDFAGPTTTVQNFIDFEVMAAGESATVTMNTDKGASRTVEITTPDTLSGERDSTVTL